MIKKTVQYEDFNGDAQIEDIYFNLSKAEIAEMEMSQKGGLVAHIEKISEAQDNKELIVLFKDILTKSVGKRSADGKRFIKNSEIIEEFISSEAYTTIFMELALDADAAVEFIHGVMPKGLVDKKDVLSINKNA